jgi:integrase
VKSKKALGRYSDGGGLWLQVGPAGNKSWLFRYMVNGRARAMGLGPLITVNLAEARERARQARQLLLDGKDPIDVKRDAVAILRIASAKRVTFEECARDFLRHSPVTKEWTNDIHRRQWTRSLEQHAFPVLGKIPVDLIDSAVVLKALLPVWERTPETASRVRGRIERVLAWAKVRKLRDGDNPAAWRGNLKDVLGSVGRGGHHKALPYDELPAFMEKLRERDSTGAKALEFTILTATRTQEAIKATWDEIDLDAKVWTIPAERMKARRQHRVPLSEPAIALLESLPRVGPRVFPAEEKRMLGTLVLMNAGVTVHGFRSTFSDWARERTAYPRDVVEMALAHTIKDKSEAAYRRGDHLEKRRRLMSEWAKFATSKPVVADVVALHG